jgi:hypothetical protein
MSRISRARARDRRVVGCRALKYFFREQSTQIQIVVLGLEGSENSPVISWIHDYRNRREILRSGSKHGRPADVYLLDDLLRFRARARRRLFEGVKADCDEIDGRDLVLGQRFHVLG